jgi:DNA repair exonuclease SbcCD ATPase subunit
MGQIQLKSVDVDLIESGTKDIPQLFEQCNKIIISDQDQYEQAAGLLKIVKSRYKEVDTQRKDITSPIDEAKKRIMALFKPPLEYLEKGESIIKSTMTKYVSDCERKAAEERRKLEEAARKQAEEEKKKLEKKIERAELSGKEEKVEELKEQLESVVPVIVPEIAPQVQTPKGVSFREKWSAIVIDVNLLPREYLIPNMEALNKVAQGTKGTIQIPGVKFEMEKILSSRG